MSLCINWSHDKFPDFETYVYYYQHDWVATHHIYPDGSHTFSVRNCDTQEFPLYLKTESPERAKRIHARLAWLATCDEWGQFFEIINQIKTIQQ